MQQDSTYHHYPSFTRRYVRSIMALAGKPKKPAVEEDSLRRLLHDPGVVQSLNGEILMLEWHHRQAGKVLVPEPSLSTWLQEVGLSRVQGDAWRFPYEFASISVPTAQRFAGHPVEGILVAWVDSETLPSLYGTFLHAHGNPGEVDMNDLGGPWLMIAIHNPLDTNRRLDPSVLRAAFRPSQITDFINSEAIEPAGGRVRQMEGEEGNILNAVARYVLSLGMYLAAYPDALTPGVPEWMKNKHPDGRHGVPLARVGYDRADRELSTAIAAPRTVGPHWRQLRDERYYGGKWAEWPRGSRYTLVSGYEVGKERTLGVQTR